MTLLTIFAGFIIGMMIMGVGVVRTVKYFMKGGRFVMKKLRLI